jgi:hypothetical protein
MDAAGTNKSITRQELQTYNAGTLTTDVKVLDLSATWNDAGVTFTGLKFNVTSTASATASLLLDLQVDGTSQIYATKGGALHFVENDVYINRPTANALAVYAGSTFTVGLQIRSIGAAAASTSYLGWLSAAAGGGSADTMLYRDAAYFIAQRNGTNAQTFRLYNTFTDASNYQRLTSTWSTSTALIHNEGAGTGADGSIAFNDAALATDTTKGFIMIPSCAGAPTGTPADIPTGQIPIVFDSTNNKLYVYDGGWISTAALS